MLIESTGLYGESKLQRVNLLTNEKIQVVELDYMYFGRVYVGEGVVGLNGKLYQLTWRERTILIYNQATLELIESVPMPREIKSGWGICTDGRYLYITEGSNKIFVVNPDKFVIERVIDVNANGNPVSNLNELEYINGEIWSNVYYSHYVLRIDVNSGEVISFINFSGLEAEENTISWKSGEVLNGIAFSEGRLFVTGKHWKYIYEVQLNNPTPTLTMPKV